MSDIAGEVIGVVRDLVRGYSDRRKGLFESHVDPLYERMLAVHRDYIAGFTEAKRYLESGDAAPQHVLNFLEDRRRDRLVDREAAAMLAEDLGKAERRFVGDEVWTMVRTYCGAIEKYFYASSDIAGISWYSDFIGMMRARLLLQSKGLSVSAFHDEFMADERRSLINYLEQTLDYGLPRAFEPINTYYALLRTRLL